MDVALQDWPTLWPYALLAIDANRRRLTWMPASEPPTPVPGITLNLESPAAGWRGSEPIRGGQSGSLRSS
jgi:hypothetical protein